MTIQIMSAQFVIHQNVFIVSKVQLIVQNVLPQLIYQVENVYQIKKVVQANNMGMINIMNVDHVINIVKNAQVLV
jgi:hypothetical protein